LESIAINCRNLFIAALPYNRGHKLAAFIADEKCSKVIAWFGYEPGENGHKNSLVCNMQGQRKKPMLLL
jgi:hypothetical protein